MADDTVEAARERALQAWDEGDLTPTQIIDALIADIQVIHTASILRTTEKSFRAGEAHAKKPPTLSRRMMGS